MLERVLEILKKAGFDSIDAYVEYEANLLKKYKGMEFDAPSPFDVLTDEELDIISEYFRKNPQPIPC